MSDLADLSATEARALIGRKALSPVELAEACIARIEALDAAVNAVVGRDFEGLRAGARAAEAAVIEGAALPPLHGLPLAVKDMDDVAGMRTTFGSELYADNIASRDNGLVSSLRGGGALPFAKTNVPEWSAGANTRNRVFGTTVNPHDLSRNCGGSSGGSAVALALGYAPLATGSDMGGSLRTPAAYCGVVGFRPSPGMVPDEARRIAALPLSTAGPMGRTVADTALLYSVMARPDARDPWWRAGAVASAAPVDLSQLRVAVTPDFGFAPTSRAVRQSFTAALAPLTPLFGQVAETHPDSSGADRIFAVLRALSFLAAFSDAVDRVPDKVGPNVTANVHEGRGYSAADVAQALEMQGAYHRRWQGFFEEWDVLLSPVATVQPRDWHELAPEEIDGVPTQSYYHWLGLAYATTLAGHPSITIPCGADAEGLPFGIQLVGSRHGDARLLAIAAALEAAIRATPALASPRPDLAALRAAPPISAAPGFRSL